MSYEKNTICVIPARRGSKRLPLKNLMELSGKPLISYAITEATKTGLFEKVYVATEDEEIADVARKYGATVPVLVPKKLCGDKNPSWKPCLYIADYLKKKEGKNYDNLLCLQPTSVLVKSADIENGVNLFQKNNYDFLVSVTPIDPHFFHWAVTKEEKGNWKPYFDDKFMKDRHELPEVFRPNGAVKIAKIEKLREQKNFFGKNLGVSFMPEERSIHVATKFDLELAEYLINKR